MNNAAMGRGATQAALNHWFARNHGVQRHGWPVTYEPTYQYEKLTCPPNIDQAYWDTLSRAETHWRSEPVKSQVAEDPPYYWHHQTHQNMEAMPPTMDELAAECLEPVPDLQTFVEEGWHLEEPIISERD